jgi:flagellar basal-body rod modification protein FlgD
MAISVEKVQVDPQYSSKSKYSGNLVDTNAEVSSYLDFDSYLKLLTAQMSNQDFNNPMSDSEFIAQMASYSTLEAINNMTNQSAVQYAAGLTGKAVTVSDGTNFEMGVVDSVTITDGKPKLMINGTAYEASKLTDVVSDTLYAIMESLKGVEVDYSTAAAQGKGIVTGGLVANGDQYLILDGDNVVPLSGITLPTGENADTAIGDAEKNGETSIDGIDGTGETTANEEAQASGEANGTNETTPTDSDDDAVDGVSSPEIDALSARAPAADSLPLGVHGEHYLNSDVVEETKTYALDNLSAPAFSDEGVISPMTATELQAFLARLANSRENLRQTGAAAISLDDYLIGSGQKQAETDDTDELSTGTENTTTATQSAATSNANRFVSQYANTVYTNTNPGIIPSDSPYYRKYAYEYPAEAALADAYGTRMFDIRFITNTAINSRIKTDDVIGYSASGKAITEIGFSGQGQLGEVNTYADGTQRVEVIFKDGKSGWYYTSGRYTLNQITDRQNWISDLTSAESDIRYYASEYSSHEISAMDAFEQYVLQNF